MHLHAQAPVPLVPTAPAKDYLSNGGFERTTDFKNLYDGVDSSGAITVPGGSAPVYLEGNEVTMMRFAASPYLADLNGDGLPDLIVAGSLGSVYWYPNIGKKGEPAFGRGYMIQTYLGTAARICIADWDGDGKKDIIFGNIEGEVNLLMNQDAAQPRWTTEQGRPRWMPPAAANFPQQDGFDAPKVKTTGNVPLTVGAYSAPVFADWDGDGLPDLIVGEGGYSANSVHIWKNMGNRSTPVFKEENRYYLAFGEGREQLTPSVYDWNGDGVQDLIVGDREGHVSLYLGTKEALKDPKMIGTLEFTKFIKIGNREKIGAIISICVCDYNEDGIPDLLYGTSLGQVMVAIGKGKRDDPEFGDPVLVKGADVAKDFKEATSWQNADLTYAAEQGIPYNSMAPIAEVIENYAEPKEGRNVFHLSWFEKFWGWFYLRYFPHSGLIKGDPNLPAGFNEGYNDAVYRMQVKILPFNMGKNYEISCWTKGADMRMFWLADYNETLKDPKSPSTRPIYRRHHFTEAIPVGKDWAQYRKVRLFAGTKEGNFNTDGESNDRGVFVLTFIGKGEVFVDDVKLTDAGK